MLLREIHHRVKNSLGIIASLVRLQTKYAKDDYHSRMFREVHDRIRSIALAHEQLYKSKNLAEVRADEYVSSLVDHLNLSVGSIGTGIEIRKKIEGISVGLDAAVPLGFIVNELVSNCLRHAFSAVRQGYVDISFRSTKEREYELLVSDDGVGLPDGINVHDPPSFGLSLVKIFAEQLGGKVEWSTDGGTECRLIFTTKPNPEGTNSWDHHES
ncbi:sensor histidine kinase [Thermodesulfobacteriota bacterium]